METVSWKRICNEVICTIHKALIDWLIDWPIETTFYATLNLSMYQVDVHLARQGIQLTVFWLATKRSSQDGVYFPTKKVLFWELNKMLNNQPCSVKMYASMFVMFCIFKVSCLPKSHFSQKYYFLHCTKNVQVENSQLLKLKERLKYIWFELAE